jgi:hypothetical protein
MFVMTFGHVGFAGIKPAIQDLVNLPKRFHASLGREPWLKLYLTVLGQSNGLRGFENPAFINGMDRVHDLTSTTLNGGMWYLVKHGNRQAVQVLFTTLRLAFISSRISLLRDFGDGR